MVKSSEIRTFAVFRDTGPVDEVFAYDITDIKSDRKDIERRICTFSWQAIEAANSEEAKKAFIRQELTGLKPRSKSAPAV